MRKRIGIDSIQFDKQFYMTSGHIALKFCQNRVIGCLSVMQNVRTVPIPKTHSCSREFSSNRNMKYYLRFTKLVTDNGLTMLIMLTRFHNPVNSTFARI